MPRKVKTLSAASYIGILVSYKPECMGFSASKFIEIHLTMSSDDLYLCSEVDKYKLSRMQWCSSYDLPNTAL